VAVCPGSNLAYFDREVSLREMVDHIYGRGVSLVPATRPHLFAKELTVYVDELARRLGALEPGAAGAAALAALASYRDNLHAGLAHYRSLVTQPAYPAENLASLATAVEQAAARLDALWAGASERVARAA
jgi:hypothetical protein